MNDFIAHFIGSFLIAFFVGVTTRNIKLTIATALLLGLGKEFFLDYTISPFDVVADILGTLIAYDVLKKELIHNRY